MKEFVARSLRRLADRIDSPPRVVFRCSHDATAVQDMLLQLKRRNGLGMF